MNDSNDFNGKNGKVKVMYVRSEGQDDGNSKGKRQQDNKQSHDKRDGRRHERTGRSDDRRGQPPRERSAWRTVSKPNSDELMNDHGGISGKSQMNPEQLRKQRLEETRIYGENACQAMFKNRPDAIVRAWFLQSVTPRFRDALKWMAANRKAYHVVDDEELTKASGTEHHGGVCFIIKKRGGMDAKTYLQQAPAKIVCLRLKMWVTHIT